MSPHDVFITYVECFYLYFEVVHQFGHVLGPSLVYQCLELLVEIIFLFLFWIIGWSVALYDVLLDDLVLGGELGCDDAGVDSFQPKAMSACCTSDACIRVTPSTL
jgi:hypothetical protein